MWRVRMRNLEAVRERLSSKTRVPVVAVDEFVVVSLSLNPTSYVFRPFWNSPAEILLSYEFSSAARETDYSRAIVDSFDKGLILEPAGKDIDEVTHSRQALREFQDVDDLTARIGLA